MKFDILIIGAGLDAAIMAERLANDLGKSVLVVDHRSHIGGHCYDRWSNNGVRVDQYGQKYFLAANRYLTSFTNWRHVQFRIMALARGTYWNHPIDLQTFSQFIGRPGTSDEMRVWFEENREHIANPANAEEVFFQAIGVEFTDLFRRYYERIFCCDLDEVPVDAVKSKPHLLSDGNYLQVIPTDGFTRMIERMLKSDKITIMLQLKAGVAFTEMEFDHVVFTGPMDDWYDYKFGPLQYRSMAFEFNDCDYASHQPCLQINNCDKGEHSRVIDYGYLAPHPVQRTTICTEYPKSSGEPFYPMLTAAARAEHAKYAELAAAEKHVTFVGSLANYRDERLDDTVASTLEAYERLKISLTSGKAR